MSDYSDYQSIPDQSVSESALSSNIPQPSGLKQPSGIPSLTKISRICTGHSHEKKPELPPAATPKKNVSEESEYDLFTEHYGLGSRSSKSKSPDIFRMYKYSSPDRKSSSGFSSISPDFYEATGRRSSSDHGADLTLDTDSFMIGQRVYVGGIKAGRITFIGEVHFAPGEWAGIVLDEPEGKNDGAVSGKRYFQCEPKKGIFSRLTRLTREPLLSEAPFSMDSSFRSMTSPLRNSSGNTSPTQSVMSSASKTAAGSKMIPEVNDRVIVKSAAGSKVGILRYKGEPHFASGVWCGVEFEEAVGKNDGSVSGQRYFKCSPNHGLFVPIAKVDISPLSKKLRRQNSQESLLSNITLGSLQSTTTSKLRMNAMQKRLSSLNKTPTTTSTPKPSYSLQDILREKSNHIEKIMKERDIDREEMTAQTILFQKNIEQYKEKILHLEKLLEEEKKKSEDLQFNIDEAQAQTEENEFKKSTEIVLRKKVTQLEEQLKSVNSQAAGDHVDSSNREEFDKLQAQFDEQTKQLHINEGLKTALENEVHNLHQQINEMKVELEMKISGDSASEAVLKEEISYFSTRVEQLETELDKKSKDLETIQNEMEKIKVSRNEELTMVENQMKEKISMMSVSENSLKKEIADKENQIVELKIDSENLKKINEGTQEVIKLKEGEIEKLISTSKALEEELKTIKNEYELKSTEISSRTGELINLQRTIEAQKSEIDNKNDQIEQQIKILENKNSEIDAFKNRIDTQSVEMINLKIELESVRNSIKKSEDSSIASRELEEALNRKVNELSESKAKLETDLISKDNEIQLVKEQIESLQREKEEFTKCMNDLNINNESKSAVIDEKNNTIDQLTKELNEIQERYKNDINDLQAVKKQLEDKISLSQKLSEDQIQKLHIDYNDERKKLLSSIEESKHIIQEKDARIDVMNKNSALLTEKRDELEIRCTELEQKCGDLTSKLTKTEKSENEKTQQLEKLQNIYDDTLKKLQEAEITNKNLHEDKKRVDVDNNDLNRKLGALEEKIVQLKENKEKLQQEIKIIKSSSLDTDGALRKSHDELTALQNSFELYQNQARSTQFELQKRIDELENQRDLANQNCEKLKNEMDILQKQKIESENQLNDELSTFKNSTDEERKNLEMEIAIMKNTFESEKLQLKRQLQEESEISDKLKNELEAKIKSLKENLEDKHNELEESRSCIKQSESRMGVAIDELKAIESQLSVDLEKERSVTDSLKHQLEELEASKHILRDEYEEKLFLERNKVASLEGQLTAHVENLKAASFGNEEKIKFLDELQQKCYQYEQKINALNEKIQHEISLKEKNENSIEEMQKKLKDIEEDQVDLVNKKEEYKTKTVKLQEEIKSLQQRRASLDEKLNEERKHTELLRVESDDKISQMQQKITELHQALSARDYEKEEINKRLKLRENDITDLNLSIKQQEAKLREEIENTRQMVKAKDDELLKMVNECSSKDNLVADLKNNLENLKTCLNNVSIEKNSSADLTQKLNEAIVEREASINEFKMKLNLMESSILDKEHQLKNIYTLKENLEKENKAKIADLMEQINILEDVKQRENEEWSKRFNIIESQLSFYQSEAEYSSSNMKLNQTQNEEFLMKIKDLEISETELKIANQSLKKQIEELQNMSVMPKVEGISEGGGQDLVEHIEFLNAIIADMHKKNLKLSKQVQILETNSSTKSHAIQQDFDMTFLEKKKPAPRVYCDICEEFDSHETEDCPTQCSEMDLNDAPAIKKDEDKKRKPIIRKYCDNCEVFDAHDTENCPNTDETF